MRSVERVPKVAQSFARLMVGESGATGEGRENARNLPEVGVDYVPLISAWFRTMRRTKEV